MAVSDLRTPSLADAIDKLFAGRLDGIHTCLPGRITRYTSSTQLADIEICVKKRTPTDDGDIIVESFPIIPKVPVDVLQTSGYFMSFPVAVGDFVWLHFVEQSLDKWLYQGSDALGSPSGPGVDDPIERRFNLKDCFATLARNPASPIAETETDALVLGPKGSGPRVYLDGSIIGLGAKSPSDFVALANKTLTELQKITTYLSAIDAVIQQGSLILEPGNGSPSALNTALKIAANLVGGAPSVSSPAATTVKAV